MNALACVISAIAIQMVFGLRMSGGVESSTLEKSSHKKGSRQTCLPPRIRNCAVEKRAACDPTDDFSVGAGPVNSTGLALIHKIHISTCQEVLEDGSFVTKIHMGPFSTNGGEGLLFSHQKLESDFPNFPKVQTDAFVTSWQGALLDVDGKELGFPPFYRHHENIFLQNNDHTVRNMLKVNGDRQCFAAQGGLKCTEIMFPPNTAAGMPLWGRMSIMGMMNDVRSQNSSSMEWWYETSFRWVKSAAMKPIAYYGFYGYCLSCGGFPGVPIPVDVDSFVVWSEASPVSGMVAHASAHSGHGGVNSHQLLFAATPADVSLEKFQESKAHSVQDLGFQHPFLMKKVVLEHLEKSRRKHAEFCQSKWCQSRLPSLLYEAETADDEVDGFFYDRYVPHESENKIFKIQKGQILTALMFFRRPPSKAIFTHKYAAVGHGCQHVEWNLWVVTPDESPLLPKEKLNVSLALKKLWINDTLGETSYD